jgi:hypothetical protein
VIRRVLIANRGEIAVRIIRACRDLGLEAVAVHSDADAGALHVRLADQAVPIGPPPARQSYMRSDAIVEAAVSARARRVPWLRSGSSCPPAPCASRKKGQKGRETAGRPSHPRWCTGTGTAISASVGLASRITRRDVRDGGRARRPPSRIHQPPSRAESRAFAAPTAVDVNVPV